MLRIVSSKLYLPLEFLFLLFHFLFKWLDSCDGLRVEGSSTVVGSRVCGGFGDWRRGSNGEVRWDSERGRWGLEMFSFSITVPYNGRNLYGLIYATDRWTLVHQHPAYRVNLLPLHSFFFTPWRLGPCWSLAQPGDLVVQYRNGEGVTTHKWLCNSYYTIENAWLNLDFN
jgi:hypothetical protein